MGAPLGTRLIRRAGRTGSAMPLHVAMVNRGTGRCASLGARAGQGRHRTKPLVPAVGPGGTDCAVELLAQEAETNLILR